MSDRTSKERVYREALQRIISGQSDIETPEDLVRWMWSVANNAIACANGLPDETKATDTDPHICGEDGPITPEQCALWLDAKYRRHGELEDRAAAMWLRKLSARHAVKPIPPRQITKS
jgi:hypothetical protein